MDKPFYEAIFLVLASQSPLYDEFKKITLAYMATQPNVKVFFVYGSGTTFTREPHDLVYDDVKETVTPPWMTMKVTRAMEYIDDHYDYNFMIRTNMSTFWDVPKVLNRLRSLPQERCLAGHQSIFKPKYITGIAMVLSRDLVKLIVRHQRRINVKYKKYVAEDQMLSTFVIHTLGVDYITADKSTWRFEKYTSYDDSHIRQTISEARSRGVDNYRVKNANSDRQAIDIAITRTLCEMCYSITV